MLRISLHILLVKPSTKASNGMVNKPRYLDSVNKKYFKDMAQEIGWIGTKA